MGLANLLHRLFPALITKKSSHLELEHTEKYASSRLNDACFYFVLELDQFLTQWKQAPIIITNSIIGNIIIIIIATECHLQ